jgi:DNA-binding MarR family transcriptional regulator
MIALDQPKRDGGGWAVPCRVGTRAGDRMNDHRPLRPIGGTHAECAEAARRAFIVTMGREIARLLPGPRAAAGQIVALLYLAEVPQTSQELAAQLGTSGSKVSIHLHLLARHTIVERRRRTGDRQAAWALWGRGLDIVARAHRNTLVRLLEDARTNTAHARHVLERSRWPRGGAAGQALGRRPVGISALRQLRMIEERAGERGTMTNRITVRPPPTGSRGSQTRDDRRPEHGRRGAL